MQQERAKCTLSADILKAIVKDSYFLISKQNIHGTDEDVVFENEAFLVSIAEHTNRLVVDVVARAVKAGVPEMPKSECER